jgi:transcriptional regulator with XRE-family HTH domain
MNDVAERVKHIRKSLNMTQQEFAERIGLKSNSLSQIETRINTATEQTIKLICREFGVSYNWLKNGVEPMMVPREYLNRGKVDDILDGDNEFVKQIFYGLADMPDEWWDTAEKVLRQALDAKKDR